MEETKELPQPEFIPIKVRRIMRVVAKAILVRLDNGEEHWVPLSQVKPPETPFKQNQRNLTIEVAEWVIENKRMGMSQEMPEDVCSMVEAVRDWDKFAITNLADRINDSNGSWLEDCLRMLVGLSPVHQEIKTVGEFMTWAQNELSPGTFRRTQSCLNWIMSRRNWQDLSMDKFTKFTIKEILDCPGFGQRSMEHLRLLLHRHGFLLEGDTRSAVEEMEESLWGVEDDDY